MGLSEDQLARAFVASGVRKGQTVLLHASLSSLGHVMGGARTVVSALRAVLGDEGTLASLTSTASNSDTSPLHLRAIEGMTPKEVTDFRARMPAFDAATSPSAGVGRIAEEIRLTPGAVRSSHPQTSFAAVGLLSGRLMAGHAPDCHYGSASPLARLYEADAQVLLLGVGYDRCTAFHLAEYRYAMSPPRRLYRCVVDFGDGPVWWEYEDVVLDDGDFSLLGADFEKAAQLRAGRIGEAEARVFPFVAAVDYAVMWFARHRNSGQVARND
ncbi:AAC(3) family N-acetyltransferase [Planotetraspora thailandica]|uniref:Aminoglycoside N(3)-acetyltransferase n=1 Tax=Planotetraspora thailandica TaxID=487172 RepID=A0A8J3UUT1_9ACTN|nr:AAC(3) family N-acetyltransferase [Planotetraspora thailandica]GII52393.1 AAC(3) family N-acetyltransferase [Planotetraspora thailandica]